MIYILMVFAELLERLQRWRASRPVALVAVFVGVGLVLLGVWAGVRS